jgi:hypothetical protein
MGFLADDLEINMEFAEEDILANVAGRRVDIQYHSEMTLRRRTKLNNSCRMEPHGERPKGGDNVQRVE